MAALFLDFETASEADIKKVGGDVYARHLSTRALMCGYAIDDGPCKLWDIDNGDPQPFNLADFDQVIAHNAAFETSIFRHVLKHSINLSQWRCSQVAAYSLSFAGGLGTVLGAIGLSDKDKSGTSLIKLFSIPQKPTKNQPFKWHTRWTLPEEWQRFQGYCIQDVHTLRELWKYCEKYSAVSPIECELWRLDQAINQRGLPIDLDLVQAAQENLNLVKAQITEQLASICPVKATPKPMMEWFGLPDFQKATKIKYLENCNDPLKKLVMKLSLQKAQVSSASKWDAFARMAPDGILRGALQFVGASRTGRWAGRGVQIHNLKRTTDTQTEDTAQLLAGGKLNMDKLSTLVRGAIAAPPGKMLVVSDLSGIESRLAGWVCQCPRINEIFAEGRDVYKDLATHLYEVSYDQVTPEMRTFAKPAALGAQYRLGAGGLRAYAEGFGVTLTRKDSRHQIQTYRALYPEVCEFWDWVDAACQDVVKKRKTHVEGYGLYIYLQGDFLSIVLPSGRQLHYHRPKYIYRRIPYEDDHGNIKYFDAEQLHYGGLVGYAWYHPHSNSQARSANGDLIRGVSCHAGGLLENIIQAVARDVLAVWMLRADQAGLEIIGHVHDEILVLADEDKASEQLLILNHLAEKPIPWATGLGLTAEGYTAQRYRKG